MVYFEYDTHELFRSAAIRTASLSRRDHGLTERDWNASHASRGIQAEGIVSLRFHKRHAITFFQ